MKVIKNDNYEIHYYIEDSEYAKACINKLSNIINKLKSEFYNDDKLELVNIYIVNDVNEYIHLANKEKKYQDWMVGECNHNERKIVLKSPKLANDRTIEDLLKVLVHEYVHYYFKTYWKNPNDAKLLWIDEGLALLLANQINVKFLNEKQFPKIKDLMNNFIKNGGYIYSGVYVKYIIKEFGINTLKELYEGNKNIYNLIDENFEYNAIKDEIKY